jgi:hypothetical protein
MLSSMQQLLKDAQLTGEGRSKVEARDAQLALSSPAARVLLVTVGGLDKGLVPASGEQT